MNKLAKFAPLLAVLAISGAKTVAADKGYPPIVPVKQLHAANDLRGKEAPPLEVQKWITGKAPNTDNKVVLIDFWATWCPPCRELIPELNGYQKKFGNDLVVIGITDEDAPTLKKFMKTHKMEYNVAIDHDKRMNSKIGVQGIPHVIIISPDHIVRYQGYPLSSEDLLTESKISQIIAAAKGQ